MKNWFKKAKPLFALTSILMLVTACSSGGGDDSGGGETPPPTDTTIAEIVVDADSSTINVTESSVISASVYDNSGSPVSGAYVSFALDKPSLAGISPSNATTDGNGVAHATLTARENQGEVNITASSGEVNSAAKPMPILSGVTPDKINVTATPSSVLVLGTVSMLAEVLDEEGNPVPDGTSVAFEVSNPNIGSMFPETDDTINGFASSTFTALNTPGQAAVEVSVGAINNSADILIFQSLPASLEFDSATPQRITVTGSGGVETSEIKFKVIDENGNPVSGIEVNFEIEIGPNGGEYIDTDNESPKDITVASDADGIAKVILRSGTTAGPVTIKGTIEVTDPVSGDEVNVTASSSIVSIGGGVPVSSRFSVAATVRNVPGLDENGMTTDITAYLSDRYGNYNILQGTTVSFWAEAALSIDAANATVGEDGLATVTARTQHPILSLNTGGQDVEPWPWEEDLLAYVRATYGWGGSTHPRDGWASVGVYTQGEEHFDDLNANGSYDSNEPFEDTHDDPFIDYNDNDFYNYTGVDPIEIFNDVDKNGHWNSYNRSWDSQKDIFASSKILITGEPYIAVNPNTFNIPNGGSQPFTILVCDRNLNYLSAGTTISMSMEVDIENGDKLVGFSADEVELDDSSFLPGFSGVMETHLNRQIEFHAIIYDKNAGVTLAAPVKLTVTVDWEGNTEKLTIFGICN